MFLTVKQVANRLNISLSLAYRLIASGEIPYYRIGSCKRVIEEELEEYLQRQRVGTLKVVQPTHRHF